MINAVQAKLLTQKSSSFDLSRFSDKIEQNAKWGYSYVDIGLNKLEQNFDKQIIQKLRAQGFKVTQDKGYDQREGDWNVLTISW